MVNEAKSVNARADSFENVAGVCMPVNGIVRPNTPGYASWFDFDRWSLKTYECGVDSIRWPPEELL